MLRANAYLAANAPRLLSVALLTLVFLYDEIILKITRSANPFSGLGYAAVFALANGLLFTAPMLLFSPRVERRMRTVVMAIVAFFFGMQSLLHKSYQQYYTLTEIIYNAKNVVSDYGSDVVSAIVGGLVPIALFVVPVVLHIIFAGRVRSLRKFRKLFAAEALLAALIVGFLGVGLVNITGSGDLYSSRFEFDTGAKTFGMLTGFRLNEKYRLFGNRAAEGFVMVDAAPVTEAPDAMQLNAEGENAVTGDNVCSIDFAALEASETENSYRTLDQYVLSVAPSNKNEYTGIFKGKNLILICAEAYSSVFVDPQLTPTLYRLVHNGFDLTDAYQPAWGGSTSTGEFSFMMGIAPLDGVETMQNTIPNNNYYTLGSALAREGYTSYAFHNGTAKYYNRNITHMNLGYSAYYAEGSGLEVIAGRYPDDSTMMEYTLDYYADKQPFSVYYMTVSGHAPYNKDEDRRVTEHIDRVRQFYGNRFTDRVLNYICYQMELEDALTVLVNKLEALGIANDTVIAMCTDHYPYGLAKSTTFKNDEDYLIDLYGGDYSEPTVRDKTHLIIWSGCLENELRDKACRVDEPTFSLDMAPTLCNLFGLEFDSRLYGGRDIFSDAEAIVFWTNHSWRTTQGTYNAKTKIYTPNPGADFDEAYVQRINQIVSNRINFCHQVLKYNYYGHLFGPSGTENGVKDAFNQPEPVLSGGNSVPTGGGGGEEPEFNEMDEEPV